MRDIRFRAWDNREKRMVDGDMTSDGRSRSINAEILSLIERDFELMQYTGLKDKNGKEIYEGDILGDRQYGTGKLVNFFLVEWSESEAGWHPFADSEENCGCCGGGRNPKKYEVIGDIYENPELLTPTA